jgi:hypothetical protein
MSWMSASSPQLGHTIRDRKRCPGASAQVIRGLHSKQLRRRVRVRRRPPPPREVRDDDRWMPRDSPRWAGSTVWPIVWPTCAELVCLRRSQST